MAAYAALCSLMHIVEQIQHHPTPPISLNKQQVQSLTENVTFLQEFLEVYSINAASYSKEADPLEARIADAAHAAEDVIESHIVDRIHASRDWKLRFLNSVKSFCGSREARLYQSLQKVMEEIDSIKNQVMEIKERTGVRDQQQRNSAAPADSSRNSSIGQNTMVGFDDALLEILDKLTGGDPGRQLIPIVGMGGMGKTTLARNVYVNPLIQQYFDVCAWSIISQEFDTREILRDVFGQAYDGEMSGKRENELGETLYKYLFGRRYLIVLDDMWSIEAWDEVRRFFPDNNNGSRIVITTRQSNLTSQSTGSYVLEMKFLDNDKGWNLLCKTVSREEGCPVELEEIGKKIVLNCRGLPLSIVVTGGLLVKSKHSRAYWEYVEENLNSLVSSEDDERCLNILYLSYKQLPVYLKPCFLYIGVFLEDTVIETTMLIRLWVAEGFLKPMSGKSSEEIAEECLEELIDRNLVHASRRVGKIVDIRIHDLVRDLCLREAQKERFYNVIEDSKGINNQRRIVIPRGTLEKEVNKLQSMSLARSLIWGGGFLPQLLNVRLLRVLNTFTETRVDSENRYFLKIVFHLVNSRYFDIHVRPDLTFPSSVCLLWNLRTLTVRDAGGFTAPSKIWMMPQLRHVEFVRGLYLPDPPRKDDDIIVLTNLHSLSTILDFKCSEEVIQRIPNLKKLEIRYQRFEDSSNYFLNNLDHLHKLESFRFVCYSKRTNFLPEVSFPHSLKKLTLSSRYTHWEDMMEKMGSLPLLEELELSYGSFKGCIWETVEGQFSNLKFLKICSLEYLEYWNSESTHFPCLQQLVLEDLRDLKEIPSGIGEIPTLESIELSYCSYSVAISANKILEELKEYGDVNLQVRVYHSSKELKEALKLLTSPNFRVNNCKN